MENHQSPAKSGAFLSGEKCNTIHPLNNSFIGTPPFMVGLFGMVRDLKMIGNKKIPTLKRGVPRLKFLTKTFIH